MHVAETVIGTPALETAATGTRTEWQWGAHSVFRSGIFRFGAVPTPALNRYKRIGKESGIMNERMIKIATIAWMGMCLFVGAISASKALPYFEQENQNSAQGTSPQNLNTQGSTNRSARNDNADNSAGQTEQNSNNGTALEGVDRDFIKKAAISGRKEVQLSQLAAQRATDPAVKQFAQQMIDEHTRSNQELMQLAASKSVALPAVPDTKLESELAKMQALSGADFDKRYLREAGVNEHNKASKLFLREASNGKDPDVRAFAAKMSPTIQQHLTMARTLADSNKTGGANANSSGGTAQNVNGNANTGSTGNTNGNRNR
jgi:putative membrane protein